MLRLKFSQMTAAVPDILARIVASKQTELQAARVDRPSLERRAVDHIPERRSFRTALTSAVPAIIAEMKKASPSRGLLSTDFDCVRLARQYDAGGAAALSVLTDRDYFHGSLADLEAARASVQLPVLRKDFTIDEFHVVEAAAHGADAILLIAALLDARQMRALRELASSFNMDCLVEVHDREELRKAVESGAEIIGVNNRNLHTFQVDLQVSLELAGLLPSPGIRVSESGIFTSSDVRRLQDAGYSAFLVGESLMKAGDPASALRELRS
jgi:indole-3-glycerol phosphate synthase